MSAPLSVVVRGRLAAAVKGPDRAALLAELEFAAAWNRPVLDRGAREAAAFAEKVWRRRLDAIQQARPAKTLGAQEPASRPALHARVLPGVPGTPAELSRDPG